MRISADAVVANRALCTHNMKGKSKAVKSSLAIGKKPKSSTSKDEPEVFMLLCTNTNRAGTKYSLDEGNIEKVFTKFVTEGKATVRFKRPAHDLCITKCDVIQLKAFLNVLRNVLEKKDLSGLTLSGLNPASTSQVAKTKTKLVITSKKDYPITTNFPSTLEHLACHDTNLKRVDSRILRLRHLTHLDLSSNAIREFPLELNECKLKELRLAENQLECLNLDPQSPLSATLTLLDVSDNKLKALPNAICGFKSLITLKADRNELTRLPFSLGRVESLRWLHLAGNNISALPGSLLTKQPLDALDLSGNDLKPASDSGKMLYVRLNFPSLVDLCLLDLMRRKVNLDECELPGNLLRARDSAERCRCGKTVLSTRAVVLNGMSHSRVTRNFVSEGGESEILFETVVCSAHCLKRYRKNPFAF